MAAKQKETKIVRPLDLGWGWTKLGRKSATQEGLEYVSFPSLAPRKASIDLSVSAMGKRDTIVVTVEGTEYEVGPDSCDLDTNDATRNLNDQYIYTDQYMAVFKGALHYMGEPEIDLLVVGLPLNNMGAAGELAKRLIGTHTITSTESVVVKDVLVLAQPMGALYYCMSLATDNEDFEYLHEESNLIIDPGFLTFDFLVSNGLKVVEPRSSAHPGGVSKILRAMADSISETHKIQYSNLSALDKGLRRRKLKIHGNPVELDVHINNTRSMVEGSVSYMKNIVGNGSDIDNIILAGGGGYIYRKVVESFYPNRKIIMVDDAQLANVKGFYLAGLEHIAKAAPTDLF